MIRLILIYMCLPAIFFSSFIAATEVDSFSLRDEKLPDATEALNKMMNNYIHQSIQAANTWGECNEDRFVDDLHDRIGGFFWTTFENDIASNPSITWANISRAESVYQDVSFFFAPALYIASFGQIMHVGKYFIGSDKLGHYIEEGFNYYRIVHREHKKLDDALAFGETAEKGHFGLQTTGVYSYADLVANYQGFVGFWSRLVGPKSKKPIVVCKRGHYTLAEPFDWGSEINAGFDEGINCNHYRNETMRNQIQARIQLLEFKRGIPLTCPILPDDCFDLFERYGDIAARIISPECL